MTLEPSVPPEFPREVALRLERLYDEFEQALRAGKSPTIEAFAARAESEAERVALVKELVRVEMELRQRAGETVSMADFRRRFPELATASPTVFLRDRSSSPPPVAGDVVQYFGEFEILEEIARGGMGVVYRARQRRLNRIVALKTILAGRLAGDEEIGRFQAEAKAAAQLDHPGIVPIYETGEHDGHHFFAMAYVDGPSLAKKIADGPLPANEAASLVEQIAEAVHYAHEKGVIHRDLKPANVLVDSTGQPRITDFGLAKQVAGADQLTQSGQLLGTPSYMPPEQARGDVAAIGPRSDVYSLGATLYALLTGRAPFQGATMFETLKQVIEVDLVSPKTLVPSLPDDLDTIVMMAMRKDPAKRYPTAAALAADLTNHQRHLPIVARKMGALERTSRWAKRNRSLAIALGVVGATMVLGTIVSTMFGLEARREANNAIAAGREKDKAAKIAEKEKRQAEHDLYLSKIARAQSQLDDNEHVVASSTLRSVPFEQRGWEHRYLSRLAEGTPLTIRGHDGPVRAVAVSPDGTRIASASDDKSIAVWDVRTGKEVLRIIGHTDPRCVAFSPDGTRIAGDMRTYDDPESENSVRLWDALTGAHVASLRGHTGAISALAFAPDGEHLASGSWDGKVKVWNAKRFDHAATLETGDRMVTAIAFNHDGSLLAAASVDVAINTWNTKTWERANAVDTVNWGPLPSLAFRPSDGRLACGWRNGAILRIDPATGVVYHSVIGHSGEVAALCFSPDATRMASASDEKTIKLWVGDQAQPAVTLRGHRGAVNAAAFFSDGMRLVSGSSDGTIKLWSISSERSLDGRLVDQAGPTIAVAISPDGRTLASSNTAGGIALWDTAIRARIADGTFGTRVAAIAFSPDNSHLAASLQDGTIKLIEGRSLVELATLSGHVGEPAFIAFDPEGKRLASAATDGTLRVWNLQSLAETAKATDIGFLPFNSGGFGRDGRLLFHGAVDGFYARDSTTLAEKTVFRPYSQRFPASFAIGMDWSVNRDRCAISLTDATVRVHDTSTGDLLATFRGHNADSGFVAFSPDDSRVVSGIGRASDESRLLSDSAKIWEATTGDELLTLKGEEAGRSSMEWSPDGLRLVGSYEGGVKIWDSRTAADIQTLTTKAVRPMSIAFSPSTRQIVAQYDDETLVWNYETGRSVHDQPLPTDLVAGSSSPDGRYQTFFEGDSLFLERANPGYNPWLEDAAFRDHWLPQWHHEDVYANYTSENWFAVAWNIRRLLDTNVSPERIPGFAGHAREAFREVLESRLSLVERFRERERLAAPFVRGNYMKWYLHDVARAYQLKDQRILVVGKARRPGDDDDTAMVSLVDPDFAGSRPPIPIPVAEKTAFSGLAVLPATSPEETERIFFGADDGRVFATNLRDLIAHRPALVIDANKSKVNSLVADPKARWLGVSVDGEGVKLITLDGAALRSLDVGERPEGWQLAVRADGQRLAAVGQGPVRVWDTVDWNVATFDFGEFQGTSIAYSSDGQILAIGAMDGTIRLFDGETHAPLRTIEAHVSSVVHLEFDATGRLLASTSEDKTLRLWHVADGELLLVGKGHEQRVSTAIFIAEGKRLLTCGGDTTLQQWLVPELPKSDGGNSSR